MDFFSKEGCFGSEEEGSEESGELGPGEGRISG